MSTSIQLRNRSTYIERESRSELVLAAVVQVRLFSKSRTEQNEFGIDNIDQHKCAIHNCLDKKQICKGNHCSYLKAVVLEPLNHNKLL